MNAQRDVIETEKCFHKMDRDVNVPDVIDMDGQYSDSISNADLTRNGNETSENLSMDDENKKKSNKSTSSLFECISIIRHFP